MIISASYRSDIPAFWSDWFRARLTAGYCDVSNPYSRRFYRVDLRPCAVDGFVFWTRNVSPFRDALDDVAKLERPFVVQFTVTGYPRFLDPHTPGPVAAVGQIAELVNSYGRRVAVWRYDPIVLTSLTPPEWHVRNFARLADRLAGLTDECIVSFVHMYRKTRVRIEQAAREHNFTILEPDVGDRRALIRCLALSAADYGMALNVCSQPEFEVPSVGSARCIDTNRLSDLAGRDVCAPQKGNRAGCLCAESRDIGTYDSCVHGCVYCYAVSSHDRATRKVRAGRLVTPESPPRRSERPAQLSEVPSKPRPLQV